MATGEVTEMLERLVVGRDSGWRQTVVLDGEPLRRIGVHSRSVYELPDMPYVLKVELTRDTGRWLQSAREWRMWHEVLKHSEHASAFAPSHQLAVIPAVIDHPDPHVAWVNVQERVMCGGEATIEERRLHDVWEECLVHARDLGVCDLGNHQCVYDARKGRYVLVDYGSVDGDDGRESSAWCAKVLSEMRTTEKPLVLAGLTADG